VSGRESAPPALEAASSVDLAKGLVPHRAVATHDGCVPARLNSLTGLRFFAATLVVFYHLSLFWEMPAALLGLASGGLTGVSFFFVLSGFVLMWSRREGERPTTFWWHRFARVWPLHALTFVLALALLPAAGATGSLLNAGLLQAWHPDIAVSHGLNQPSWSLSAEAFFYLLFPLLAVAISRARPRVVIAASAAGMLAIAVLALPLFDDPVQRWLLYDFPLYRLGEFVAGMALAVAMRQGWRPQLQLRAALCSSIAVYVACSYFLVGEVRPFVADAVMAPMFGLVISAAAASDLDGGGSRLGGRWLVSFGQWSFALYLIHWPVLSVMARAGDAWWAPLAAVGVSLALAGLLFGWFERPVERWLRARHRAQARATASAPAPAPAPV
jgi:peptidoglycan/LPS O-acetylase OafA/YrhL